MAQSRVNKVASIFTRINGLLKAKIVKEAEKPLWVDIYKAFPPARDPIYRSAAGLKPSELPKLPPKILYAEDRIRSLYFKKMTQEKRGLETQVLSGHASKPIWEIFTQVYSELEKKGEISGEENLIKATLEELESRGLKITLDSKKQDASASKTGEVNESTDEFLSILNKVIDQSKTQQVVSETKLESKEDEELNLKDKLKN